MHFKKVVCVLIVFRFYDYDYYYDERDLTWSLYPRIHHFMEVQTCVIQNCHLILLHGLCTCCLPVKPKSHFVLCRFEKKNGESLELLGKVCYPFYSRLQKLHKFCSTTYRHRRRENILIVLLVCYSIAFLYGPSLEELLDEKLLIIEKLVGGMLLDNIGKSGYGRRCVG